MRPEGPASLAWLLWIACSGVFSTGCQSSQQAEATVAGPREAVIAFLEAVRRGEDQQLMAWLTPLAQRRTAEQGTPLVVPASDTASFDVREAELLGTHEAQVASVWQDLDVDGNTQQDHITWLLRREDEGWRIVAMVTQVSPGQEPAVLNFEDPGEMQALQGRAQGAAAPKNDGPLQTAGR